MTHRLSFTESGRPGGQSMLLLHGFLSSNHQWDPNRVELASSLHLVEVELMGHGSSDAPNDPAAYSLDYQIAELERIRREAGINRWWVCGQSMGGAVALRYTLSRPDHVAGVIFTNSRAAFGLRPRPLATKPGNEARSVSGAKAAVAPRDLPFHPINAKRFPQDLKQTMVAVADSIASHVVEHTLVHRHTWSSINELDQLAMPVLLVNGSWEKAFQPCIDLARSAISDLTIVNLEGGHSINVEQPEAFSHAVRQFVSKTRSGPR